MIKLKFDEKEYLTLMELVYLGNWMINSINTNTDKKYDEIESKIFSNAQTAGYPDMVEYNENSKEYIPSVEFDESMDKYINEYDEVAFWERLIIYMTLKDLREKYKDKKDFENLTKEAQLEEIQRIRDKYNTEFETYGVDRLFIKN